MVTEMPRSAEAIIGQLFAHDLIIRAMMQGRAATEPDPVAWLNSYTKQLIASVHAVPIADDVCGRVRCFIEESLLTLAKNVSARFPKEST